MEIKKAFIVVEVEGKEGLRQIALTQDKIEILIECIMNGVFWRDVKIIDDVVAEVSE